MRIRVAFRMAYPWPMTPEEEFPSFVLSPAYNCRSSSAAHDLVLAELRRGGQAELIDEHGDAWPFHIETVASVITAVERNGLRPE